MGRIINTGLFLIITALGSCSGWVVAPPTGNVSVSVGTPVYSPAYIPTYIPPVIPSYNPGPSLPPQPIHVQNMPMGMPFGGNHRQPVQPGVPALEPGPVIPNR